MANYVILATFTDKRQSLRILRRGPKHSNKWPRPLESPVKEIFWTQGRYDIVAITEAPDEIAATALNLKS